MFNRLCAFAVAALALAGAARAAEAEPLPSLKEGEVALKSAGPLAFGPQGILFVGDPQAATLYALDTGDRDATAGKGKPSVEDIGGKIAALLGTEGGEVQIKDIAVNPISGNTYLSVARGKGPKAAAVLLKVTPKGDLSELDLKKIKSANVEIAGAAEGKSRLEAITHLGYVKGRVLVAGLSNEEFASRLRSIPFPFDKTDKGTGIEIYHGAHGKFETRSPIRVFTTYKIGDEENVLAAYTCTPLVRMPL
ncbi:MAG: hypothetical protein K2W96_26545, partial [Gemmataceae bacterium]|nr:hypothetical protein [Gemmataceae bacterium]